MHGVTIKIKKTELFVLKMAAVFTTFLTSVFFAVQYCYQTHGNVEYTIF